MKRAAVVLVLAAAVLLPAQARADGDPASDYLIQQQVFLPYDAKIPKPQQDALLAAVRSVNKQGFKIRVALIWSDYDLGSVTSLWKQPRRYARFLGFELGYYYRGRLLVVMPNGFGTANMPAAAARPLGRIAIGPGPDGLLRATETAVERLAAAQGVHVSPPARVTTPAQRNARDRIHIVLGAAVLLAAGLLLRLALRRRAATA